MNKLIEETTAHPLFTQLLVLVLNLAFILLLVRLAQLFASRRIADKDLRTSRARR